MLLTSSDTKQTLMHLFLFTNSVQRELVSICTQSTHNFPCMTTLDMIYYIYKIFYMINMLQSMQGKLMLSINGN